MCDRRTLGIMAPNTALRQARLALRLSQDEMAVAIRDAGHRLGTPNGCTKRLVQRWEAGQVALPRAVYVRALEYVTGRTVASLGFDSAAERYGLDPAEALATGSGPWLPVADANRLVHVFQTHEAREGRYPLSMPDYQYYREHASVFDGLAAHYPSSPINFVSAGESREINGSVVTASA